MRATRFTIEAYGDAEFDGYTNGELWNGWACPYFTRAQAMKIVAAHNTLGDGQARYDESADSFVFSFNDGEADTQDAFPVVNIEGRALYPIGAFCWIWEESATTGAQV